MIDKFGVEDAKQLYGVDNWGAGYFDVNTRGHLTVLPTRESARAIDVNEVVENLTAGGFALPVLLRFPQILTTQVHQLCEAFEGAIAEYDYGSTYHPVYPVKVNQQQSVVREVVLAGRRHNMGIEVGSKTELLVALSLDLPESAFVVCNGFKDYDYIRLAMHGRVIGRNVVVVVERYAELEQLVALSRQMAVEPMIGLRMKLSARGSGRWEKSAGYLSKFGLSTVQLLECMSLLRREGMCVALRMLHFHTGSQVPDIRRVKAAIKEAAIVYAKIAREYPSLEILNVGGGLGVDYDGSKTASDASVNYTISEFAADVVYTIKEVCQREHVREPRIVTETGRVMTAYHSILIVDTVGAIRLGSERPVDISDADPEPVAELKFILDNINSKNVQEYYHDAVQNHDEVATMFGMGICSLHSRGRGEALFWQISRKAVRLAGTLKFVPEELKLLENRLAEKAICNFSVFQSVPDAWALDMLFPIVPVSQLDRRPTHNSTLVDLTCDSDGEIDRFVDQRDIAQSLPLHDVTQAEPYRVAVLLLGAYQEVLGDFHNLFGAVSEAHVILDDDGRQRVTEYRRAQSAREIVRSFGYEPAHLEAAFEGSVDVAVGKGLVDRDRARAIVKDFSDRLERSSYLDAGRGSDRTV